uniref:Uncharacterized protein n=1 Tax=Arundo donax TaxID=35708 RepID=A0A0A9A7J3_ARUDO
MQACLARGGEKAMSEIKARCFL